jgi:N-acetylglucosamine-6-sulfatase
VPLVIRGAGFPAGRRVPAPSANVDLVPTILTLAGARATRPLDGVSLVRLARRPRSARGRALLLENERMEGVRTGRFLYVEHATGARELYDLRNDPYELRNLAADGAWATTVAALGRTLARLRDCAGRSCRLRSATLP